MGKVKNNKKKQARHNATGMQTNAELDEEARMQAVPMETILPLIAKVLENFFPFCSPPLDDGLSANPCLSLELIQ